MGSLADMLMFASAALLVASAAMTAFGLRRPRCAGWGWWVLAMWLTTLGTLLGAIGPGSTLRALAAPLLLQWPILTLVGLRRFWPRLAWPASAASDWTLLALVSLAAVFGGLQLGGAAASDGDGAILLTACGVLAHLYAALVLFMAPGDRDATPLYGLAATMALAAFGPGLASLPATDLAWPLQVRAAAAALGALVLASVAQTLVCERTERQLRESRLRLRTLANLETLAPVPNQTRFAAMAAIARLQDPPGSAVLLLFDIDHFQQINDHLGHAAGDRAQALVAGCVLEHLRSLDVAGRQGGDKFVQLLRQTTTADAIRVAARIVGAVQAGSPEQHLPPLSLSFGLVQLGAEEGLASGLRRADQALVEAQRLGRSRAVAARGDERQPVFSVSPRLGLPVL